MLSPEQPSSRRRSSSGGSLVFRFKSGPLTAAGTYTVAAEYTENREHLIRVSDQGFGLTHVDDGIIKGFRVEGLSFCPVLTEA